MPSFQALNTRIGLIRALSEGRPMKENEKSRGTHVGHCRVVQLPSNADLAECSDTDTVVPKLSVSDDRFETLYPELSWMLRL